MRVDVENVSMEALWALGALEKGLKRPDVRVGVLWKGCRKQPPKAPFFCRIQRLMRLDLGKSDVKGTTCVEKSALQDVGKV